MNGHARVGQVGSGAADRPCRLVGAGLHHSSRKSFGRGLPNFWGANPRIARVARPLAEADTPGGPAESGGGCRGCAAAGGPRYDVEYRVVRPDGNVRIIHSQGDVTWDETGRPLRQFGVLQDITELRQAERELRASEEALRRSEAYLAEAQRLSHTGTFAFDATAPVYWSDESYRIGGLILCRVCPTGNRVATDTSG